MPDAYTEIESHRATLNGVCDTAAEFVRSVQGVGPRHYPGGGFAWQEPTVTVTDLQGLRLRWAARGRALSVEFRPGDINSVVLYRVNDAGQGRRDERGPAEAIDEVVALLVKS